MKSKTFNFSTIVSILFIVGIMIFCSCDKNESTPVPTHNSEIISNLDNLCIEIQDLTDYQIKNNGAGIRAKWWKYLITAAADACGALVPGGSIGTGISASSLTWTILKDDNNTSKQNNETANHSSIHSIVNQKYTLPKESAGFIHNKTIERAYNNNGGEDFFNLSEEKQVEILNMYMLEISKEYNIEFDSIQLSIANVLKISKSVADLITPNMTVEEYTLALKTISPDVAYHRCIDILSSVIEGLANSSANEDVYINNILNAIQSSELDKNSKERISNAVSIAFASSMLWNINALRSDAL